MAKKLSIPERFNLLDEAIDFFSDLSDAGEENYQLSLRKAAALGTVKDCLELYQQEVLEGDERTEETLKKGIELAVDKEFVDLSAEKYEMTEDQKDFYESGFGMAIGLLTGDNETIDGLRELQGAYDEIVQGKLENRTIADLFK